MERQFKNEIEHGKKLSQNDPEFIWGWGSPAGRVRAERRAYLISKSAGLKPGVHALEVGCGTGLFTEYFARAGASIIAVDISRDLIEKAQAKGLNRDRVRFIEKPFEECEIDGPFDAVIGSSVLHHLDLGLAIPKIFALLKPGGMLSFAEPNMLSPQIFIQKNIPWIKELMGDSPDETAFVRFTLRNILKGAGFTDISIRPFDWLHPLTPESLIKGVSRLGAALEKIPGVCEFAGSLLISCRRPRK
jgi:2-polyprenyl-3-methyl-5-hydroxy-6-metoxy-1,4-benzoquinol methylase